MRVTVIAPPWYAIPPSGYGGIEWVVALLADGLVDRGHEVILFAPPGSQAEAELVPPLGACWWDWSWCSWRRGLDRHDHPAPEPAAAGDHRAQTGAGEDVGRGAGGRGRDTAGRAATIGGGGDQPAARNLGGGVTAPAAPRPRAEPSRRVATPRPPPPTGFTLVASGDVLAHGSVVARASAYGARSGRRFDFRPMFAAIRPLVSAADLAVCHLETPLSPSGRRLSGYPRFNAPPQLAAAIHHAGYDACSVASNHAMDQGVVGVAGTLAVLDRAGLLMPARPAAPRKARPRVLTVRRVRVALLSYTYGLNGFRLPRGRPWLVNLLAPGRILADARAARRAGSQFTVVFLHWGEEYRSIPTPAQRRLARRLLADPAVDLLVGHHAHVVQPIERGNGKWVAFGLGNSLSAQSAACCPAATQDGVLLQATIVAKAGRMVVARLRYVPTWVEHPSYRILRVARVLARGSAGPATRALLRASLRRTTAAVGHATRPAAYVVSLISVRTAWVHVSRILRKLRAQPGRGGRRSGACPAPRWGRSCCWWRSSADPLGPTGLGGGRLVPFQAPPAGRVDPNGHEPGRQDPNPGDPHDVPEPGHHPGEGAGLPDHLGDGDGDGPCRATTEYLLAVDDHQGGQQRDGHREGDHADPGRQVQRGGGEERLHHGHADRDQPAVDQVALAEPFLFLGRS